ncbi:hypothetical protein SCAR479_12976 [Seiridium cardinale]|uniref:Uncharacterized protein n=1 Tax=Seiridium cardinale TaxID=138064 RepID=A0ABR2X968_9PEZI
MASLHNTFVFGRKRTANQAGLDDFSHPPPKRLCLVRSAIWLEDEEQQLRITNTSATQVSYLQKSPLRPTTIPATHSHLLHLDNSEFPDGFEVFRKSQSDKVDYSLNSPATERQHSSNSIKTEAESETEALTTKLSPQDREKLLGQIKAFGTQGYGNGHAWTGIQEFTAKEAQKDRFHITGDTDDIEFWLASKQESARDRETTVISLIVSNIRRYRSEIRTYHSWELKHDILCRFVNTFKAVANSKGKIATKVRNKVGNCDLEKDFYRVLCRLKQDWGEMVADKDFMEALQKAVKVAEHRDVFKSLGACIKIFEDFKHEEQDRRVRLERQEKSQRMAANFAATTTDVFEKIEEHKEATKECKTADDKARYLEELARFTGQLSQQLMGGSK